MLKTKQNSMLTSREKTQTENTHKPPKLPQPSKNVILLTCAQVEIPKVVHLVICLVEKSQCSSAQELKHGKEHYLSYQCRGLYLLLSSSKLSEVLTTLNHIYT